MNGHSQSRPVRIERHRQIAAELESAGDGELLRCLGDAGVGDVGHGTIALETGSEVFAKLVPVTTKELLPENRHSTANLFELPTYYQYRIGSLGFGAWRELRVHRLVHEWVTSGTRTQFPLLHHWRILGIAPEQHDDRASVAQWGGCAAIANRVSAVTDATASVVLFLESFPETLAHWLASQLRDAADPIATISDLETRLVDLLVFIRQRGLIHMDAHFDNLLTDGSNVFLSDYGLAMSRAFELGSDELAFLQRHRDFDICTALTSLMHAVVSHYHPEHDDWRDVLRRLQHGHARSTETLPVEVRAYLTRRAPIALEIGDFYGRLTSDLTTQFPDDHFRELLDASNSTD